MAGRRGFAAMDETRQREIARKGGRAAHERGTAHEFTPQEAAEAGRKGGKTVSQNRQHMAEIGRRGGKAAHSRNAVPEGNGVENRPQDEAARASLQATLERTAAQQWENDPAKEDRRANGAPANGADNGHSQEPETATASGHHGSHQEHRHGEESGHTNGQQGGTSEQHAEAAADREHQ